MSRYQLGTAVLRLSSLSMAAWEKLMGDTPGGQLSAFCVPAYTASMPHLSTYRGTPEIDVTVSAMRITPCFRQSSPTPSKGWQAPVDVSACTRAITRGWCFSTAALISSYVKTCPPPR